MFTIPNEADAAFAAQAAPDKVDVDILVAGHEGTGVVSGCAVTAQGTPDMTLAVAAGTVSVAGVTAAVTAGNVTITTAHATNPRFDLVVVSSAGVKSVTAGLAAASPVFPAIPANSVVLAAVYVPANDTAIGPTQITDKRVSTGASLPFYLAEVFIDNATQVNKSATSSAFVDFDAAATVTFTVPSTGNVLVEMSAEANMDAAQLNWGLWDSSAGTPADIAASDLTVAYSSTQVIMRRWYAKRLTGLTPGASLTYKWRVRRQQGAGSPQTSYGGAAGPAIMQVRRLP